MTLKKGNETKEGWTICEMTTGRELNPQIAFGSYCLHAFGVRIFSFCQDSVCFKETWLPWSRVYWAYNRYIENTFMVPKLKTPAMPIRQCNNSHCIHSGHKALIMKQLHSLQSNLLHISQSSHFAVVIRIHTKHSIVAQLPSICYVYPR